MGSSKFTVLIILFATYSKFHFSFYNHLMHNNFKLISLKTDQYFLSEAVLGVRIGKLLLLALYKEIFVEIGCNTSCF